MGSTRNMSNVIGIIFSLFLGFSTTALIARVLPVGHTESIRSIKAAIAQARNGDTLRIQPGIYKEGNILLTKSLTLLGVDFPILDGENKYEILTIHAHDVSIVGLRFENTGTSSVEDLAAIGATNCRGMQILRNQFKNNFFGIHLANVSHSTIAYNNLQAETRSEDKIGNGIHLWKCADIKIDHNKIIGHRDGIYFEFVTHSLITYNHSERNLRYGLHFMFSNNDEYRNNTFLNNGAGVAVMFTKGVKMIDNTFDHNWGASSYGLLLKEISDSYVIGNKFIKNSIGIFMEGNSRIEFTDNSFIENGYAIKLQASCDDNVLTRNNFSSNTFDIVSNGHLVLNTINGNYWDRYDGYDLNHDGIGDVPYRPVSMYGMIVEQIPTAVLLWRSFLVFLLDRAEKALPVITPENLKDDAPSMKAYDHTGKH